MASYFTTLDWIVLLGYFAATMSLGFYFYRRSRSTDGFMAANRSLPGWVCGLSIFATFVSSISFLALPGKAFVDNWNPFVFSLSIPVATWIGVRWFVPYYRQTNEVSAYALLEERFGTWARVYASLCYLSMQVARMGVIMYLMALPMAVIFGWDMRLLIVLTGICVTFYAFVGGIVAVIWTDALQAIVLLIGALVCLAIMMMGVPGGPSEVFRIAWQHDKFSLGSFEPGVAQSTFWVLLIYGLFINLQNFGIDQSYVQRYVASRSESEARKSLWLGGLLYLPVSALFFLIGTTLFVFYTTRSEEIPEVKRVVAHQQLLREGTVAPPASRQSLESSSYDAKLQARLADVTLTDIGDRAFPHFIAKHLPPGATGLLVAAIFAAAMSTVSTSLNSSATLLLRDFYQRFIQPNASERQSMAVLYGATIVWGALGTAMAFFLIRVTESALDTWWMLASIFSGGMLGLFLLGMLVRSAKSSAALVGVVLGVLVIAWMTFSPAYWGYLTEAEASGSSSDRLTISPDASAQLAPGQTLHLRYQWIDRATDRRQTLEETRTITSVDSANQVINLNAPLSHPPASAVTLFRDSTWYRWRSPFHNYLAIVIGTCVILLAGTAAAVLGQSLLGAGKKVE